MCVVVNDTGAPGAALLFADPLGKPLSAAIPGRGSPETSPNLLQMVRRGMQPTPTPPSWHTMGAMNVQRFVSGSYISTELRLDWPS